MVTMTLYWKAFIFIFIWFSVTICISLNYILRYQPAHQSEDDHTITPKTILLYNDFYPVYLKTDDEQYLRELGCPTSACQLTYRKEVANYSDAIIFHNRFPTQKPSHDRAVHQIWIWHTWESPMLIPVEPWTKGLINWTATYRRDSDIDISYGRFLMGPNRVRPEQETQQINFAANKTKLVAWFVSNMVVSNRRFEYAKKLSQFIEVDIYGRGGNLTCPITDSCYNMLKKHYKFYLAFENANCREYITEKLFYNSLGNNVVPVVMGAPVEDYERLAPKGSFIHVDEFESPEHLANYLKLLNSNDTLYNEYFRWKQEGFILNQYYTKRFHLKAPSDSMVYKNDFWCQVCVKLHQFGSLSWMDDLHLWWEGKGDICIRGGNWDKRIVNDLYRRLHLFRRGN